MIRALYAKANGHPQFSATADLIRRANGLLRSRRSSMKHVMVPAAVLILGVGLAYIGLRGSSSETLPVTVNIRATADPQQLGATTSAQVELYNHGDREVRPRFSLFWLPYPYYWRILSGPAILMPGERATYEIAAPDVVAAPHDGDSYQIKVNDADSITYAISAPVQIAKRELPIVNPRLRMWTQRNPSSGLVSPAGWQIYRRAGGGDAAVLERAPVSGVDAVRFRIVQDGQADPGDWAHTGLLQEVPFPEAPFELRVLGRTPYRANDRGWPLTAFGLEVSDATNGLIWLLFQPTGSGDREYDLPSGHHIVVYDVPIDQWVTKTIDLPELYHRLNWAAPKNVTLNLFVAAASAEAADVEGYILDIAAPVSSAPPERPSS